MTSSSDEAQNHINGTIDSSDSSDSFSEEERDAEQRSSGTYGLPLMKLNNIYSRTEQYDDQRSSFAESGSQSAYQVENSEYNIQAKWMRPRSSVYEVDDRENIEYVHQQSNNRKHALDYSPNESTNYHYQEAKRCRSSTTDEQATSTSLGYSQPKLETLDDEPDQRAFTYGETGSHDASEEIGYTPSVWQTEQDLSGDDSDEKTSPVKVNARWHLNESGKQSHLGETAPMKMKTEWGNSYSHTALKLMERMGYEADKGLGKKSQGRLEPIQASTQEGRRGLGLKLDGLDAAAIKWEPEMEDLQTPEQMDWLKCEDDDLIGLSMEELADWVVRGSKKLTIDDETKFCDPQILSNVLSSKSIFDNLGAEDMRRARTRSNPFETIGRSIFINRAAVKMANMDSLCDFMFTSPVDEQNKSLVRDLLYFADICAGPGGFSEYVLFRKHWHAKGFGFTLKKENDFKLHDFYAGSPETFDPYYGVKQDGNIYDPENIESFTDYVLKQTDIGVHFVMADGGFSVEGKENIQEILSKQLYLCQCLVALSILREKGHFVVKLFDLFTPFSVGLIYLMYKCFEEICICKPNTSRPANSERYLICKWKKSQTSTIQRHLFEINREICENKQSDILEIVCCDELVKDRNFCDFITNSNNRIGQNQIVGLLKIAAFCNDNKLKELRQFELKKKCLELWKLPERMRQEPEKVSDEFLLDELLKDYKDNKEFLSKPCIELNASSNLKKEFISIYDWYFVPIGREESADQNIRTLFLCKGRTDVLMLTKGGKWVPLRGCTLEITPKTLLYGEIITELIGEGRSQNKISALHIIDAIALGGEDIRRLELSERLAMCEKFAKALNKPYKQITIADGVEKNVATIRCKKLYTLADFNSFFDQMSMYRLKDNRERLGLRIRTNDDTQPERFFVPGGIMFLIKHHPCYTCRWSKTYKHLYYYDLAKNELFYKEHTQIPVHATFRPCFTKRLEWKWTNIYQVEKYVDPNDRESSLLYRNDFCNFLQSLLNTS